MKLALLTAMVWPLLAAAATFDIAAKVEADGMVHADDKMLDAIFSNPRDYHVVTLLTAESPQYGCQFCHVLGPDVRIVAKNWVREHPDNDGLYFVLADVDATRASFQKLKLTSAPNLAVYPPGDGKRGLNAKHDFAEFTHIGPQVEYLCNFLSRYGFQVNIHKPFPWDRFAKVVGTAASVIAVTVVFWSHVRKFLTSKQLWLAFSLVTVLIFTAGHMFNVTRGTLFVGGNNGRPVYFQQGYNTQFGVETQIVAVVYALLSFLTIALLIKTPRFTDPKRMTVAASVVSVAILLGYSYFIAIYQYKYGNYPYGLLPVHI